MAFVLRIIKARILVRTLERYKEEKKLAFDAPPAGEAQDSEPIVSSSAKSTAKEKLWKKFEGSSLHGFLLRFKRKNSKENVCAKSFLGFIGGILLTYIFFFFFVYGVRFPLGASTYICMICGVVFCLGLAFSKRVRCYVLLMIPVFFSKEGRQVLMTYALYLSLMGPGKNTMQNMGILSDSMACGQEMIKKTLRQVADVVRAPFRSIKETLARIVKNLKDAVNKIKELFDGVTRIILGILRVIKKAVSWLGSIINFCNKKLGTPFQRCMKTFDDAIEDCKAKMGIMDFLCHVVHVVKTLCYTVKFLDLICLFTEFVSDNVIGAAKKKLREFGLQVKNMLYVSIEYSHSYEFRSEASNSTKLVSETILQKMVEKFENMDKFLDALGWAFSLFFIFIFYKVYYYKYKYMSSDRYDNHYITKHIRDLDFRRVKMNKETVLPLEHREKKHFGRLTSVRLLKHEQQNIIQAMFLLTLSTLKIVSFIVCDYCLYWVLFTIYHEGHRDFAEVQAAEVELYVSGKGSLAEFYRKLGKSLKVPSNADLYLNPVHCLPDPIPPDKNRYFQIGFLTILCWLLTITEPYGLRLRNIVMSHYYPDRAKERAVWLYNHILRSRGSFLKFARRQLRRKSHGNGDDPIERVTLVQRIMAKSPILSLFFGRKKEDFCLVCGAKGTLEEPLKKCKTPSCPGIYCFRCYSTLNNICTVCQHPIEYGDISDVSEERDSSEEGLYAEESGRRTNPIPKSQPDDSVVDSQVEASPTTFKDLETRPKFRDLEDYRVPDYAQTADLDADPADEVRSEHLLEVRKLLSSQEAYKIIKKKASNVLTKLKDQKAVKLKSLMERKKSLINILKRRLQEQRSKMHQLPRGEDTDGMDASSSSKYDRILRRAKILTKKLKRRKSMEMARGGAGTLSESSDTDKENDDSRATWETEKLRNVNYSKMKELAISRMKKAAEERGKDQDTDPEEMEAPLMLPERTRQPYSNAVTTSSEPSINSIAGGAYATDVADVRPNALQTDGRYRGYQITYVQRMSGPHPSSAAKRVKLRRNLVVEISEFSENPGKGVLLRSFLGRGEASVTATSRRKRFQLRDTSLRHTPEDVERVTLRHLR